MQTFSVVSLLTRVVRRVPASRLRLAFVATFLFCFPPKNVDAQKLYSQDNFRTQASSENQTLKLISYPRGYDKSPWRGVFDGVLWLVDDSRGYVAALNPNDRQPLWSDDGVVFQHPKRLGRPPLEPIDRPHSSSDSENRAATAFGRVYFLLDARDDSAKLSPQKTFDLLIALDLHAQGRLVWTRRADEFQRFFPLSNVDARCEFSGPPQPTRNDVVNIEIKRGDFRRVVSLNASDGSVLSTF